MSFPRYPAYKDSGVEWLRNIPSHWAIVQLRHLVDCLDGQRIPLNSAERSDRKGDIPYWGANSIQDYIDAHLFDEELVLLGEDGAPFFDKTKPVAFRSEGRIWPNNHIHVLRPRLKGDSAFLTYCLNATDFADYVDGSTRDKLTQSAMNRITVTQPSKEERAAIVRFLDRETAKIDALVAEQEQLITLLKEKRQAVISHAVTKGLDPSVPMKDSGVEWLGEVPARWEITSLKRHWTATDCKHVTAEFAEDGIPLASIREVQSRWVELADAKRTTVHFYELLIEGGRDPRPGDLIFSRNATVGEVAQVHFDHPPFAMGQDVVLLRRIDPASAPDFLQLVIRSTVVTEQLALCMIGSTFKRINVEEIRSLVIAFPPPDEQRKISTYLIEQAEQFDQLIEEALLSVELLQERRSALISAAVTGQIDVRDLATQQEAA